MRVGVHNQPGIDEVRENELLAGLPSEDFERLLPDLERVALPPFEILYDFDDEITHIYFPNRNTVISTLCRTPHSLLLQTSQTALCNRIHSDEQRLARWLLLSDDRVESNQLPLPRELLAKLLGRNHSGVSVAASTLERAGLISYNGAELEILDREKLETVACSCYWVVKRQAAKMLDRQAAPNQ